MKKILLLYSLFLISFTLFSYLFVDLNLIYFKSFITGYFQLHRGIVSTIYILSIIIFFIFYYLFLKKINSSLLKKLVILSFALLFLSYPAVLSYDIFNYIFTSKVLYFYHENPYVIMPIEFKGDPLLLFTHAPNKVALYAPFWITISSAPFLLGFGKFALILFNFKLMIGFFYLGTTYLIYKMTKNVRQTAFFSLNPLVIIETLVSSHNDIVMIFFALLSFYFLRKKNFLSSLVALTLSILIKYSTIFLPPIYTYVLVLKIRKRIIKWDKVYLFATLSMFAIFYLSFLREEIYPWYAIWFLAFAAFIPSQRLIRTLAVILSFSLLFRYVPFMYLGTYFGQTPAIKIGVTFIPASVYVIYHLIRNKKFGFLKRV